MAAKIQLERAYQALIKRPTEGLSGAQALWKEAKKRGVKGVSLSDCRQFLQSKPEFSLFKPARKNYPRNRIVAHTPGEVVQIDLADFQSVADGNNDQKYALLAVDTFSRFLFATPIPNRKPVTVIKALRFMLTQLPFHIRSIYWDKVSFLYFISCQVIVYL